MFDRDDREIWARFACAAISALDGGLYESGRVEIEDECRNAASYADEMLRQYRIRFKNR